MSHGVAARKKERRRETKGEGEARERRKKVQRWKDIRSAEERKWVLERKAKADREVECVEEDDDRKEMAAGKWKRKFLN